MKTIYAFVSVKKHSCIRCIKKNIRAFEAVKNIRALVAVKNIRAFEAVKNISALVAVKNISAFEAVKNISAFEAVKSICALVARNICALVASKKRVDFLDQPLLNFKLLCNCYLKNNNSLYFGSSQSESSTNNSNLSTA